MNTTNIWILHHYSTPPSLQGLNRPYYFVKNFPNSEIKATIYSSSYLHYAGRNLIKDNKKSYELIENDVRFIFVKTRSYNNIVSRALNMIDYYRNVIKVALKEINVTGKPDIIIASSAHPLALLAGKYLAKKFDVKCIFEIRDLWPESFSAYNIIKKNSILMKILYQGEKWLYKIADGIIFTMEGGKDYIIEKKWSIEDGGRINLNKVFHINNGVDLEEFNRNASEFRFIDADIDNKFTFKVIYTGSIRKANNVLKLIKTAEIIGKFDRYDNIVFLIFGTGDHLDELKSYIKNNDIKNVKFKGYVEKKYIPNILKKSDLNIFNFNDTNLKKYGASLNKLFEYFASGKPTISDCEFNYDLIKRYECGEIVESNSIESMAKQIVKFYNMESVKYDVYCKNALTAANEYDFKNLSMKLLALIEVVKSQKPYTTKFKK